jgi:hypothetical protein
VGSYQPTSPGRDPLIQARPAICFDRPGGIEAARSLDRLRGLPASLLEVAEAVHEPAAAEVYLDGRLSVGGGSWGMSLASPVELP